MSTQTPSGPDGEGDPRQGHPSMGDPSPSDASLGDPSLGDPSLGHPSLRHPQSDPDRAAPDLAEGGEIRRVRDAPLAAGPGAHGPDDLRGSDGQLDYSPAAQRSRVQDPASRRSPAPVPPATSRPIRGE